MHTLSASFILGYHGCYRSVADSLLNGADFAASDNAYDWLGPGVYFWEANPKRGLSFIEEKSKRDAAPEDGAVVGAVIDLGLCLDVTSQSGVDQLRTAHAFFEKARREAGEPRPSNSGGPDRLLRQLDCAVIKTLHALREEQGKPPLDTVKGVFVEGAPIYDGAGVYEKTHIQICVRNPDCIKGVFRVPDRFL